MILPKLDKSYVSEIDQFLAAFEKKILEPSASQQEEIAKYQRIAKLRDEKSQQK